MDNKEIRDIAKSILLSSRVIIGFCRQHESALNRNDVSSLSLHICYVVTKHGSVSLTEVAEYLNLSPSYASIVVDGLVAKGLLVREKDQNNRRKCIISIAPTAAKRIQCMEAQVLLPIYRLIKKIGIREVRNWIEILRQIEDELYKTNTIAKY